MSLQARVLPFAHTYTQPGHRWAFSIRRGLSRRYREGQMLIQFSYYQMALCDFLIKVVIRERMWKKAVEVRAGKGS